MFDDNNDYVDEASSTTTSTTSTTTTHHFQNVTSTTTTSLEARIALENLEELIESSNCTLLNGHTFVFSDIDSTAAW